MSEIAAAINEFRSRHLAELTEVFNLNVTSLFFYHKSEVVKSVGQGGWVTIEDRLIVYLSC